MVRPVTVQILTAVACVCAAPGQSRGQWVGRDATYSAQAYDGSLGIGYVDGGNYGPGSFNIGHGGAAYGTAHGGYSSNIGNNNNNIGNNNNFGNNNYNGNNNSYGGSRDPRPITNVRHSGNPGSIHYLFPVPVPYYQP